MAAKKKAKSKTKPRKTMAKRPAIRKKPVKVTKKPAKLAKKPAPAKVAKKPAVRKAPPKAAPPPPPPPPGERIGVVTHYFGHLSVAVVKLESTLRVGDTIHIRGHTTDFSQRVESLQVEHAPVSEVGPNDDFGLKVNEHVREHDVVYKVK